MKLKIIAVLAAFAAALAAPFRRERYQFANIAEGVRPTGNRTYLADAVLASRFLVVKIGSDNAHCAAAVQGDIPIGVATDQSDAAEDPVNVQLFGAVSGTIRLQASAAIAAGDQVVLSATAGQVRTLPVSAGTYYIVGRALEAASAAGDLIECIPVPITQRVV